MLKLRADLALKEKEIITAIEKGDLRAEFDTKHIKVAQKAKILSARLNLEYRILFRRTARSWVHLKTIHRKELERIGKKL